MGTIQINNYTINSKLPLSLDVDCIIAGSWHCIQTGKGAEHFSSWDFLLDQGPNYVYVVGSNLCQVPAPRIKKY